MEVIARSKTSITIEVPIRQSTSVPRCPHNKRKTNCVECYPKKACEHNRIKIQCRQCTPRIVCEKHGVKNTSVCRWCNPEKYQRRLEAEKKVRADAKIAREMILTSQ